MKIENADIDIKWLGHAGFMIKNSLTIYIDPYNIKDGMDKADVILITHSHYDHCSLEDLNKIVQEKTRIICTADCQSKITRFDVPVKIDLVEPNQELDLGTIRICLFETLYIGIFFPFTLQKNSFDFSINPTLISFFRLYSAVLIGIPNSFAIETAVSL